MRVRFETSEPQATPTPGGLTVLRLALCPIGEVRMENNAVYRCRRGQQPGEARDHGRPQQCDAGRASRERGAGGEGADDHDALGS